MKTFLALSSTLMLALGVGSQAFAVQEQEILPVSASQVATIKDVAKSQLKALISTNDRGIKSLVEQARLMYWVGQFSKDEDERLKSYETGMSLMDPFLQNKSENPAPVLLWAANAGGYASQKRNLASLKLLDQIEQKLLDSASQYPEFESGAAHRALADIYFSAPPFISVGSKKKALKHAQIAYKIDPHHPGNMLIMAKLFRDDGAEDKARALFKEVLILASPDRYPFDFVGWRSEALEGLDAPQGLKVSLSVNG